MYVESQPIILFGSKTLEILSGLPVLFLVKKKVISRQILDKQ
ncbi:hypothetical protein [Peribacillus butanolivorans]